MSNISLNKMLFSIVCLTQVCGIQVVIQSNVDNDALLSLTGASNYNTQVHQNNRTLPAEVQAKRIKALERFIPVTFIPPGFNLAANFDYSFEGVRISRIGNILRVGKREYQIDPGLNNIELVTSCRNFQESLDCKFPLASFIDQKVNFLSSKFCNSVMQSREDVVAEVSISSQPGLLRIGSVSYGVVNGKVFFYPLGMGHVADNGLHDLAPFISQTITQIHQARKANRAKTKSIDDRIEAKAEAKKRYEAIKESKARAAARRKEHRAENLNRTAMRLGASANDSTEYKRRLVRDDLEKRISKIDSVMEEEKLRDREKSRRTQELRDYHASAARASGEYNGRQKPVARTGMDAAKEAEILYLNYGSYPPGWGPGGYDPTVYKS